ncbi:MAG: YncE family protein [Acidobacteriaceae bacterium]|nr:YncE family protein [Acidobacteriaceae bacterium]MBV9033149.1 YncE family protein [Acidobacteriaceae bacterium]MBV9223354.1 YncE family protein [Acidobacteriaceae bacterium]
MSSLKPRRSKLSLLPALALGVCVFASEQPLRAPYSQTAVQNGTSISVNIGHADPAKTASDPLTEFEHVVVRVSFKDVASGSPLPGGSPAAWIDRRITGEQTTLDQCVGKVKRFAEGSTFSHSEVDLTSYFVVIMNSDPTLTVVDPRFGYGDTRLLAMVSLHGPGEDWILTEDGKRLFVSVPAANEVVAVDTAAWKVISSAGSIPRAARVALQPDEAYLWAAYNGDENSGVAVLNARDMNVVARIRTGRGYHHMAFSADSSLAFVTNPSDGTVSVIDVRKLVKLTDVPVGVKPTWIAYSDLAKAAYVANEGDGKIVAIDTAQHKIRATMSATPGLGQIRFAPGGRFALAVNPNDDKIYVVDAASNQIVQQGKLDKGPDQIAFTNKTAHIRHRGSDVVLMIALASLGTGNTEISAADFPGGRYPPGEMSLPTPADGIVQASGENGVLVANPGDKSVYFYMEGSAAPMGNLSNYGREPRAVLSVDRNLRERSPGVYETTATLPAAGSYDFALFLDRPRTVSCFNFPIASDPSLIRAKPPKLKIEPRITASTVAGEPTDLAFRLTFADTGKPDTEAKDVVILMVGPTWQRRSVASHRGDGIYSVDFKVPAPGIYNVLLSSQSRGLTYLPYATVTVKSRPN